MNLGGIHDLGNLDQALASTLKSLELKPDNPTAHMNLGIIYNDSDKIDHALASTINSATTTKQFSRIRQPHIISPAPDKAKLYTFKSNSSN